MRKISYAGYRFPPELIHQAIWLYHRFTLSFRDVEDLLAERGIAISYETVRRWVNHFGPRLAMQVRDTGVGIPEHQQALVFQEYYQLGNPERDRTKGLGLGLAIVRRLADLLGCPLMLRSRPGKVSCFEVVVPLATERTRVQEPSPDEPKAGAAARFVVVIEDEQAIRGATSSLLKSWGHRVIAAGSGDEAIERLSSSSVRPDLLICDYRLRGEESGVAVIERLRSGYNEAIPAVLITGDMAPGRGG
jgi:hypothetical protein